MNFEILDFLILIGVIQGFIFAIVILFSKFFKNKTNLYLGISLLLGVFINIQYWALHYDWYKEHHNFRILEDIELVLVFPVTLYFYYLKLLNPSLQLRNKHWVLFVPFIISIGLNLYIGGQFYFDLYPIHNKSWIPYFYSIEYYFSILFNLALLVVEFRLLFKNTTKHQHDISYDLKWIRLFYTFHVLLIFFWIITSIVDYFYNNDYSIIIWLLLNILFYWIGYQGIYKFTLAKNRFEIREINKKKVNEKQKEAVKFKKGEENPYFKKFIQLLESEKLYRNQQLSRDDIATRLNISVGYLSQIINSVTQKNFSDYLNLYRVKEAKIMILDPEFDNYDMVAIGLEAGFNSKSAFYKYFKKETGHTPTTFKRNHKE
ncbi:helix-turn-helix protein [Aquimarina sp. MAR_2010_214]|uniref:helix-turn-helix domain-containing protein n=1 Tax=Aquimarina sp. MAR_2010_214 TaxID=1250026 RepID=UPI000C70070C|nr:helix-turn-helix domain-containing protein [Aquimarina sp. MAR_2010_214]PKV52851.1 helix-turn-helix protein [Aquimarina sp. MAR_2010_214]